MVLQPESFRGRLLLRHWITSSPMVVRLCRHMYTKFPTKFLCAVQLICLTPLNGWSNTADMSDPYFFGYGSLVNSKTHVYQDGRPAKLSGWRRVWKRTNARDMAFLTIVPSDRTELLGLIAKVPNSDWVALDAREEGYDRLVATEMITHDHSGNPELAIYAIPEATRFPPTPDHPILLSYLDVVLQGYLNVFGESGVQHFMETTDGWDTVVLNDRANPIYPRAQSLSADEISMVDQCLSKVRATIRT